MNSQSTQKQIKIASFQLNINNLQQILHKVHKITFDCFVHLIFK